MPVVIYSGGMDSFTLLHKALAEQSHKGVVALSVNYGQKHKRELVCAQQVTEELDIPHRVIDLSVLQSLLISSLTTPSHKVPEGHYADENMKQTIVPNRNMILLSIATGWAISLGMSEVWFGAHAGDHQIYPDCRPAFIEAMNGVTAIANYQPVKIIAPFSNLTKTGILAYGLSLNLDYSKTWTCYCGNQVSCGHCGSCSERREAFELNGEVDPLPYAA